MKLGKCKIWILTALLVPFFVLAIKNISKIISIDSTELKTRKILNENFKKIKFPPKSFYNKRVFFFLDFEDFSCLQCEKQVIQLCKWIESKKESIRNYATLLLVRKHHNNKQYYNWVISNWVNENKIKLEIQLDNNAITDTLKITKTSIALLDRNCEELIEFKEFPLVKKDMESLLKFLEKR